MTCKTTSGIIYFKSNRDNNNSYSNISQKFIYNKINQTM